MTRYTIFLGLTLLLWACSNDIVSNEQRERYESCRKTLVDSKKYTNQLPSDIPVNDSVNQFYKDICDLSLDELVTKYKFTKDQIDPTIASICISSDIINSFKNLDIKLLSLDSTISTVEKSLNNSQIKINKIKPISFMKSKYVIVGDDTLKLKVNIAAYDSLDTPKRNKIKKLP